MYFQDIELLLTKVSVELKDQRLWKKENPKDKRTNKETNGI